MNFDETLKQVKTRSDLAIFLAAGTTGFLLDAGLNIMAFLESGAAGAACATGALSIKIAIEELIKNNQGKKTLIKKSDAIHELLNGFNLNSKKRIIKKLSLNRELYLKNMTTKEEFNAVLNDIVKQLSDSENFDENDTE